MAQTTRMKDPLQGMINGILIETGKALRAADREGGKSLANANSRIRTNIPGVIDNFHQVLDECESEIVRAKAVLLRDLEELRAKRYALENPSKVIEEEPVLLNTTEGEKSQDTAAAEEDLQSTPQPEIIKEKIQPANEQKNEDKIEAEFIEDPTKEATAKILEDTKAQQGPSPPSSANEVKTTSNPIGLGIDTSGVTNDPGPTTAEIQNASIDSLFEMPDGDDNEGDLSLNFETMDFSFQDSSGNTQNQEQSQTQNNDLDMSSFANTSDFNMPDLQASNDANLGNNADNNAGNNPADTSFGTGDNNGTGDIMDLDIDLNMAGGDDSLFDDMFFGSGDNDNMDGEDRMKHGEFDNAFFGLDD